MIADALRQSRQPLYLQVAEVLRQRLTRGVWEVGTTLPSFDVLAQEFAVAKITVRQAVKILEKEGLLAPKRGRGTVVLPQTTRVHQLNVETRLSGLVEMYRGDRPELDLLDDRVAALPGELFVGTPVEGGYHLLRRTHSRDGQTYCVISLYFEQSIFDRHEAELRSDLALPVLFDSADVDVQRAQQTLVVGKCDLETASLLDLPVGDPVAEVRRILCDGAGRILYLADVTYRGDFIKLEMDLLA